DSHAPELPGRSFRERVPGHPRGGPEEADRGRTRLPAHPRQGRSLRRDPLGGHGVPSGDGPQARYQYTLVVGPDSEDRAWVEGVLMRGGLEVAAATEADLAALPDIVPPNLVILDDNGNKAERMASFKNVRAHPALVGVPVVVLAYDADIDSFSEAITKGAAAYLVKPASAEELVGVAHKLSGWLGSNDRTEKRRRLRRPLLMKVDVDLRARKIRVPGQIGDAGGAGS